MSVEVATIIIIVSSLVVLVVAVVFGIFLGNRLSIEISKYDTI